MMAENLHRPLEVDVHACMQGCIPCINLQANSHTLTIPKVHSHKAISTYKYYICMTYMYCSQRQL